MPGDAVARAAGPGSGPTGPLAGAVVVHLDDQRRRRRRRRAPWPRVPPECRALLVSASCRIRYAARSTLGGQRRRVCPPRSTCTRARAAAALRPGRRAGPGPGAARAAALSPSARSTPSTERSSTSACLLTSLMSVSADRARSGCRSIRCSAVLAWTLMTEMLCATTSCRSLGDPQPLLAGPPRNSSSRLRCSAAARWLRRGSARPRSARRSAPPPARARTRPRDGHVWPISQRPYRCGVADDQRSDRGCPFPGQHRVEESDDQREIGRVRVLPARPQRRDRG